MPVSCGVEQSMSKEKILILDDEPYVLDICRRILEEYYDVKIAHSGLEAIELAKKENFDLLLTDIKMPGINGLETIRKLKSLNPDTVCVTMTGFSTMENAIEALRLGVDEFVTKPFAPEELSMAIESALEKERLRKENIRLKSLLPLFEFNKSLLSTVETITILEQVMKLALAESQAVAGGLGIVHPSQQTIDFIETHISSTKLTVLQTHAEALFAELNQNRTQTVIKTNLAAQPSSKANPYQSLLADLGMQSLVITPLLDKDKLLGGLILFKETQPFSPSECNFLSVMAGQAAIAYQNAGLFEDLQKAYQELKTLDHLKSEFTNIAAHELRTPLAVLMGYAAVMQDQIEGIQKDYLDIIIRNAMRLRNLIDDLMNMRSIAIGKVQLAIAPLNLANLINEVVEDMQVIAEDKQIKLKTQINGTLPTIKTDAQKLTVIFDNLISNAIKFTAQAGEVTIQTKTLDREVEIAIIDTGIGIPVPEFERIFERFYQVQASLSREFEGIGLGLSIVKGFVENLGGRIWVESKINQGSRFIFTLPLETS